jgi:hypothetical protein
LRLSVRDAAANTVTGAAGWAPARAGNSMSAKAAKNVVRRLMDGFVDRAFLAA